MSDLSCRLAGKSRNYGGKQQLCHHLSASSGMTQDLPVPQFLILIIGIIQNKIVDAKTP